MTAKLGRLRVYDILEAARVLELHVLEFGIESVSADIEKRWIMERGLEIISEASRHLPVELKDANPSIQWQKMADLGNRLRHGYDRVDTALLWDIIENDVPVLVTALEQYSEE